MCFSGASALAGRLSLIQATIMSTIRAHPAAAARKSSRKVTPKPRARPATAGPTTTPRFMATRLMLNASWRRSGTTRSAIMALLAVWNRGQPNALSTATSTATCHTSVTNANPTNHTTPMKTARRMTSRRPMRSVSWPPRNCSGITAAGTRPKTTPTSVIEAPTTRCR